MFQGQTRVTFSVGSPVSCCLEPPAAGFGGSDLLLSRTDVGGAVSVNSPHYRLWLTSSVPSPKCPTFRN